MFFFLSTIYLFFYFSKNLFYKLIFFFIFYITSILFFLIIKKNIFGFFLILLNASALIIFFTFLLVIINFKKGEKKNIYLFFQCPFLLQKIYEYFTDLYGFFFSVKTYKDPIIYKKEIEPSFSFLHPETDPGLTTTQGTINYGRRLISKIYDGSNFEETSFEESLGIVEQVTNTNLETQTVWII